MTSRNVKEVSASGTMSEKQLQSAVIELLHVFGFKVGHFRPALMKIGGALVYRTPVAADGAGFFDLFASKPCRAMVIELKSQKGKLAAAQTEWQDAVEGALEHYVWRPSDWLDGTIERILAEVA